MFERFFGRSQQQPEDPTMSSVIAPKHDDLKEAVDPKGTGIDVIRRITRTDSEGRLFHRIIQYPQDQMFLARILKGIIPVSDVVFVPDPTGGNFFSYEIPLEKIIVDRAHPYGREQAKADTHILQFIFSDWDHRPKGRWYQGEKTTDHNMISQGKRMAFFDFEMFAESFIRNWGRTIWYSNLPKESSTKKEFEQKRLAQLKAHLEGEAGLHFLHAILEEMQRSGAGTPQIIESLRKEDPNADPAKMFQEEVLRRIDLVEKIPRQ